ncbi:toxin-antitoxin system YwqK family antitoxin [Variovorax sp. DXTD-1]|uniref:toxin-antitoxin system YwqK family antitoxin n=1 Tax=Variovorax sp. DXTD-1 TaxID=2495592 RepID=UPI000F88CA37|nr:toxin-antitoxin system YwqK family antitoxin [Variovorax sp. DXTD-1]RST46322.1 toxin-antitoxin system YwqK family antitoxin [Variovorax sp. DXTD-1]
MPRRLGPARRLIPLQALPALALLCAHVSLHPAWAADGVPAAEKYGYRCLYSRHITQDPSNCVVGYFDKNGVRISEEITERNLAQVEYYRVLLDKDASGRLQIASYYPGGEKKVDALAIGKSENMLSESNVENLGADGVYRGFHANGKAKELSSFRQGRLVGSSTTWYPDGQMQFNADYFEGEFNGRAVTYFPSGQMDQESYYAFGKLNGAVNAWHDNGVKKTEAHYDNGKSVGDFTTWYPNGKKQSHSQRLLGALDGTYTEWYDNGQKKLQQHYVRGVRSGEKTQWYANGQRMEALNFVQGELDGLWQSWYDNGQIKGERQYKSGQRTGPFTHWYWNGKKKISGQYVNGKLDGVITAYGLDGTSIERVYELGVQRTTTRNDEDARPATSPRSDEDSSAALPASEPEVK